MLQILYLQHNRLSTLPESFWNLKSLTYLHLYGNNLKTLPESIGNLKSLTYLNLVKNKLTTLPESIGNLSSLQTFNLTDNKLTTLPESINILEKRGVSINGLLHYQMKKEEEEKARAKKIVSFRGAQIPQFEADVLQELENQLGKQFTININIPNRYSLFHDYLETEPTRIYDEG